MKDVWKFGTRWDENGTFGTSIFKNIFLKYGIAFVYGRTPEQIKEGDLLAFSDGYDVIAIGKALSPPAPMTKFDLTHVDPKDAWIKDANNWGCRAEIVLLDDADTFQYKKPGRFYRANQYIESVNNLYEKYTQAHSDDSNLKLNLFHWANKELAQDSFLCWLLCWAGSDAQNPCSATRRAGRLFLNALLEKAEVTLPEQIEIVVYKQYNNIDILAKIIASDKKYVLLIEDKTHSGTNNPLKKYIECIQRDKEFDGCEILPFFVRTGDFASYEQEVSESYKEFKRDDFLKYFESIADLKGKNQVLDYFVQYMLAVESDFQSFRTLPIGKWKWNSWKGFFSELAKQQTRFKSWQYIPNASGGFLSSIAGWDCFNDSGLALFLQIESDKRAICLKLGEVYKEQSASRDKMIALLDQFIQKDPSFRRPARLGVGCYMTLKLIDAPFWLGSDESIIEIDKVVERLNHYTLMLEGMRDFAKQNGY